MSNDPTPPLPPPLPALSFGGYASVQPGMLEGVSFWPRVGARVIDLVVHYAANFGAQLAFGIMLGIVAVLNHVPVQVLIAKVAGMKALTFLAAVLGGAAYHAICEGLHGSTVGKLALGMVVVQEDGTPCRVGPAVVRGLGYFVDAIAFGLVAYMAMQKSLQQQRYGDQWAHTVVVKRAQVAPQHLRSGARFLGVLALAMMVDAALLMAAMAIEMVQ